MTDTYISDLDQWLREGLTKAGEEAPTSHPSSGAEDGLQDATTGERASENTGDVKSDTPGQSVDEASGSEAAGAGRGENAPVNEIGTKAKATGEDPSVETASAKASPSDPGTSHPAKADMGEKYSVADVLASGTSLLADLALLTGKQAAEKPAEEKPAEDKPAEGDAKKEDDEKPKEEPAEPKSDGDKPAEPKSEEMSDEEKQAKQAGQDMAAAVIEHLGLGKQAKVDPSETLRRVVKEASDSADAVADYLIGFTSKQAMDGGDDVLETGADEAAAGVPGEAGPAEGGDAELEQLIEALIASGVTPEDILQLVEQAGAGGAGGGEEEAMPAEAAGVPPMEVAASAKREEKKAALRDALQKAAEKSKAASKKGDRK